MKVFGISIGVWRSGSAGVSEILGGGSIPPTPANLMGIISSASYSILTPESWIISRSLSLTEDHDRLSPA